MTARAGVNSGAPGELKDLDPGARGEYIWSMATTTIITTTALDALYIGSDYDLTRDAIMDAAVADGWTAAAAEALAAEELAARDERWEQESRSELAAERANESYFENRGAIETLSCPWWAQ